MNRVLLIGCGNNRQRKIAYNGKASHFLCDDLVTLDIDPNCGADIVMDINELGKRSLFCPFGKKLPFNDNTFDELASYDCLEHVGTQGDWRGYFLEFGEYHRILKPGGTFGILVPIGYDALADPGHSRFFQLNHFAFLSQKYYEKTISSGEACTDYRWYWKKNFDIMHMDASSGHHIAVILRKT